MKFLDLKKLTDSYQPELGEAIRRVVDSGYFVGGDPLKQFEQAYASYTGTGFCIGVGNGFDALRLIFKAYLELGQLKEGDEIIVPANTYIASILAITESRLTPVLVEPDEKTLNIDPLRIQEKVGTRTKGMMLVHLYGRNAMHPAIRRIADEHGLKIFEDNAQAAGCYYGGKRTGSIGDAAAHSFFPTKNLGALGDAGAVTTDDSALSDMVRTLSNYGSHHKNLNEVRGVNSRLDTLQAAILQVKLVRLDLDNARRNQIAAYYLSHIRHPDITLPFDADSGRTGSENVWHLFVIRSPRRDDLHRYLSRHGIETLVHYPIPPHRQKAFEYLPPLSLPITERIHEQVLSLPLNPVMTDDEVRAVAETVNRWPAGKI
jgi:dTDP-4-amino-4,6-dideoxygalactose transaminase